MVVIWGEVIVEIYICIYIEEIYLFFLLVEKEKDRIRKSIVALLVAEQKVSESGQSPHEAPY